MTATYTASLHFRRVAEAVERASLTITAADTGVATIQTASGAAIAQLRFTPAGSLAQADAWSSDGVPVPMPPAPSKSRVTAATLRENLIAWLDRGRPTDFAWRDLTRASTYDADEAAEAAYLERMYPLDDGFSQWPHLTAVEMAWNGAWIGDERHTDRDAVVRFVTQLLRAQGVEDLVALDALGGDARLNLAADVMMITDEVAAAFWSRSHDRELPVHAGSLAGLVGVLLLPAVYDLDAFDIPPFWVHRIWAGVGRAGIPDDESLPERFSAALIDEAYTRLRTRRQGPLTIWDARFEVGAVAESAWRAVRGLPKMRRPFVRMLAGAFDAWWLGQMRSYLRDPLPPRLRSKGQPLTAEERTDATVAALTMGRGTSDAWWVDDPREWPNGRM